MIPCRLFPLAVLLLASSPCNAEQKHSIAAEANIVNANVVFFVRDRSGGSRNIRITIFTPTGATISKQITKAYSAPGHQPPACGSAGNASFDLSAQWYIWSSGRTCPYPTTVYDAGSMRAEAGACVAIEVNNLWACPLAPKASK